MAWGLEGLSSWGPEGLSSVSGMAAGGVVITVCPEREKI